MLASQTKVAVGSVAHHSLGTFFDGGVLKSAEQCFVLGAFMGSGRTLKHSSDGSLSIRWDQKIRDYAWLNELSAVCCQITDKSQLSLANNRDHFVPAQIHQRKLSQVAARNWYASSLTLDHPSFASSLLDYSSQVKVAGLDDSSSSLPTVPKHLFRSYLRGLFESNLNDDHSNVIITNSGNVTLELLIDKDERFLSAIVSRINELCFGRNGYVHSVTDHHIRPFGDFNNQFSIRFTNPMIIRELLLYLYESDVDSQPLGSLIENSVIAEKIGFVLKVLDLSIHERVLLIEEYKRQNKEKELSTQEFLSSYFDENAHQIHEYSPLHPTQSDTRWNSELTIIPDPSSFVLPCYPDGSQ